MELQSDNRSVPKWKYRYFHLSVVSVRPLLILNQASRPPAERQSVHTLRLRFAMALHQHQHQQLQLQLQGKGKGQSDGTRCTSDLTNALHLLGTLNPPTTTTNTNTAPGTSTSTMRVYDDRKMTSTDKGEGGLARMKTYMERSYEKRYWVIDEDPSQGVDGRTPCGDKYVYIHPNG